MRIQQRLPLVTKAQVLAKVTEVLAVEPGGPLSLLTDTGMPSGAKVYPSSVPPPGTGGDGKFYLRPSRLLAYYNQQMLSSMDGAPEVYSDIFPRLIEHVCHAQRLSLL